MAFEKHSLQNTNYYGRNWKPIRSGIFSILSTKQKYAACSIIFFGLKAICATEPWKMAIIIHSRFYQCSIYPDTGHCCLRLHSNYVRFMQVHITKSKLRTNKPKEHYELLIRMFFALLLLKSSELSYFFPKLID